MSQATSNIFEKTRRPLQERIDRIASSKNGQSFSDEKDQLSVLFAASAKDVSHAYSILKDPITERKRLMTKDFSEPPFEENPLTHFFVNQRVEGLVELAETRRLDGRAQRKAKVFLAEKKSIFGIEMSTIWYCRSSLLILTALLLALATYLLKLSLSRY